MNYVFIKRYNPAYDFFLIKYFRDNGIKVGSNLPLQMAETIAKGLQEKGSAGIEDKPPYTHLHKFLDNLAPPESLFWSYVHNWRSHPESRPAVDYLFKKIFDKEPDVEKLRELESQLPAGQKLLFTNEDAANEIAAHFYKRYMHGALRRDMEAGAVGKELSKYFSDKEWKGLPDIRFVGPEKLEEAVHRRAGEFLAWLSEITREKIMKHIAQVLEEHSKGREHMKVSAPEPRGEGPTRYCLHETDYVKLSCFHHNEDNTESLSLSPSRGYRVWEKHNWEDDYADMIFPQYRVMKLES